MKNNNGTTETKITKIINKMLDDKGIKFYEYKIFPDGIIEVKHNGKISLYDGNLEIIDDKFINIDSIEFNSTGGFIIENNGVVKEFDVNHKEREKKEGKNE